MIYYSAVAREIGMQTATIYITYTNMHPCINDKEMQLKFRYG